jgi:hypothetical protein
MCHQRLQPGENLATVLALEVWVTRWILTASLRLKPKDNLTIKMKMKISCLSGPENHVRS